MRAPQRLLVVLPIERLGALVQAHDDIGAQRLLAGDGALRGEAMHAAVDVRAEGHAVRVELAHQRQAEDLEAARIGEHRAGPAHEGVHAAEIAHQVGAGPQIEVKGVGQHQRGAELAQIARGERLDGGLGAHRREHRGEQCSVRCLEASGARGGLRVVGGRVELEHGGARLARGQTNVKTGEGTHAVERAGADKQEAQSLDTVRSSAPHW